MLNKSVGPRVGGFFGVLFGAGCIGYTWYTTHTEGKFMIALCLIGPAIMVVSLGFLLVPLEKLVIPTRDERGRLDYNLQNPKYTPLGMLIFLLGLICSGLYFAYLKYGMTP
jgi:hypothetical protein